MYLEGVIVCVNYADFLAHTLPHNKNQFNNLVVVTDTKDQKTKEICEYYHVKCLQTDIFYENGNDFNKGAAINYALSELEQQDWIIHMDADIYMPPLTRHVLENLPLEEHKIYGADRLMCPSYDEWDKFMNEPSRIHEGWIYIHMNSFPMGVRIAEYMNKSAGWEPLGYFQLWNPKGSGVFDYPTEHDYCDRTDVLHAKKFPRKDRELLPEVLLIHLDSEGLNTDQMGKNWKGRKTSKFCHVPIVKSQVDLEIESVIEELKKIVEKYQLSDLKIKVKNKTIGFWKKLYNKGMNIILLKDKRTKKYLVRKK